ncbi:class II aldolase/adducin family protein [uncultured Roseobacter sp.]|uniref:class II aldolase/adducin family protein n=1 Tax=uncultured Roseobacter sp. TaxID=114847 RepID=UPI002628C622|nr:class II aldolase/adducin family protein [uncultured Roseobacter sp.]
MTEKELRKEVVAAYQELSAEGMNKGASGNVSARLGEHMLITPSGIPSALMEPDQVAKLRIDDDAGGYDGPCKPSSEWRFHRDILRNRQDAGAVVHAHAPFSTILSILRKPIPAVHYMMAAFGTTEIKVADYCCYGTPELSQAVITAMEGANGCLMANHGMVVAGPNMTRTMWLAGEIELLASQYYHSLLAGTPHILSDAEIAETAKSFESYGPQEVDKH